MEALFAAAPQHHCHHISQTEDGVMVNLGIESGTFVTKVARKVRKADIGQMLPQGEACHTHKRGGSRIEQDLFG